MKVEGAKTLLPKQITWADPMNADGGKSYFPKLISNSANPLINYNASKMVMLLRPCLTFKTLALPKIYCTCCALETLAGLFHL